MFKDGLEINKAFNVIKWFSFWFLYISVMVDLLILVNVLMHFCGPWKLWIHGMPQNNFFLLNVLNNKYVYFPEAVVLFFLIKKLFDNFKLLKTWQGISALLAVTTVIDVIALTPALTSWCLTLGKITG